MTNTIPWSEPFEARPLAIREDERGMLFEIVRFLDDDIPGQGQVYAFSIVQGARRGDHYHERKQEWFTCVHGTVIVLLTSADGLDARFSLDAANPQLIYAGPGTTHAVLNRSQVTAVVVSIGSEQHNPEDEDTYRKIACPGETLQ